MYGNTQYFSHKEMGMLSRYIKPNFMGLLKNLNSIHWFIVFFSLINLSVCIYEDQIGKFDWRQSYVGRIKFAQFDTVSTAKKIIVATEENVLAALNLKTGQVVWRHVFEGASTGNIQLLHVTDVVVTVTGTNPYLVRGWDSSTGVLLWEWSVTLQNDDHSEFSGWWVHQGMLVHMLPVFGSHLEITMYHLITGQNKGSSAKLPTDWIHERCVLSKPYYTCLLGAKGSQLILSVDVTSNAVQIISAPLSKFVDYPSGVLRPLDGNNIAPGFIINDRKVVMLESNRFVPVNVTLQSDSPSVTAVNSSIGPLLVQTWNDDKGLTLIAYLLSTGLEVPEIGFSNGSLSIPEPEIATVMCTKTPKEQHACRILISGADEASHLLQHGGRTIWTREEALANVVAVEFVDLPVSDLDAAIESEFDQKEGSIWSAFTRRIHTQLQQLQTMVNALQRGETSADDDSSALVRDYFNLHKIMVLVTEVGKIFGMDNLSGEILWKLYEPNLDTDNVRVFTRKSARRTSHDAYITIVGKHDENGDGLLLNLNPIRGTEQAPGALRLRDALLQAALHPHTAALVLLYQDETVEIIPESAAAQVNNMYMYVADRLTATVQGYAIVYNGEKAIAQKIWSLNLGGEPNSGHRIVAAVDKGNERVHSPGRVLADRSVLYKYLNPNLVLFVTEGPDPVHKDVVVATCVDAVTGAVIFSQMHRRARALPLALHTDNMMAYLYHNDKHRRTEIASLELYEGKSRWSGQGAWGAEGAGGARRVWVERRAHVVPGAARAAARTRTLRALTDVHLLLWVSSGAVVEIPWAMLEARRALPGGELSPEAMGPPLAPELILAPEAALSYNLTLARPRQLHVAAPDLESTTLVLATGLDLFYTRVAPSKTFDLLKDDFDYSLITMVLTGLILASYATKYFASRKMLKMAWK